MAKLFFSFLLRIRVKVVASASILLSVRVYSLVSAIRNELSPHVNSLWDIGYFSLTDITISECAKSPVVAVLPSCIVYTITNTIMTAGVYTVLVLIIYSCR